MNAEEIKTFIVTQLLTRWPEFKPSNVEVSDLAYIFKPTDEVIALKAVREHSIESNWSRPKLKKIKDYVEKFSPKPAMPPVKIQPKLLESTVFVGLERSDTTLLAGYFVPVELGKANADESLLLRSAAGLMERLKHSYGGEWKIFNDVNCSFMTKWRLEKRNPSEKSSFQWWVEARKRRLAEKGEKRVCTY